MRKQNTYQRARKDDPLLLGEKMKEPQSKSVKSPRLLPAPDLRALC